MDSYTNGLRVLLYVHRINAVRGKGRQEILAQQKARLDRLLRFALKRSPFYAKRFQGADFAHPTLADFPPIDKKDVMEHFDEIATDPAVTLAGVASFVADPTRVGEIYQDRYIASHTSGSSGVRGIFVIDRWGWEMSQALVLAGEDMPQVTWGWPRGIIAPLKPVRCATVIPNAGHYTSALMPRITSPLSGLVTDIRLFEITDPFEKIVGQLNELRPFALHSYPSMLDVLARFQERGDLRIRPRIITAGGEPFSDDIYEHVQRAWPGTPLTDIYAATEAVAIARRCFHGGIYHLNEDWLVVENVDADGHPVPLGERGDKILVTHLFNYLQPLIRYELTDSLIFDDAPCVCGSSLLGVKILGRTNDALTLPGREGREIVLLPTPLLVAFMDAKELRQYQIVQEENDRLHINYTPEDGADPERVKNAVAQVLAYYFERHGVSPCVRLSYRVVPEIPRDPRTHKVMQIISRL